MRKLILSILVFLNNLPVSKSCGYSPHGEDVRYCLFQPDFFNYTDFASFNYNANWFGYNQEELVQFVGSNVIEWYNWTGRTVPLEEIDKFLNKSSLTDIVSSSKNGFINFLYKKNRIDVINYFKVAKECEVFNIDLQVNEWENHSENKLDYSKKIRELEILIRQEKKIYLKRKYAFLAIRLSYYCCNDQKRMAELFKKYFSKGLKDYLYYWALYFKTIKQNNSSLDVANVFVNSSEKRYAAYFYYKDKFDLNAALASAKTKEEIANCYSFVSIQRTAPNLDFLEKIYDNSKKSRVLDFLLIREINKIEDWVYTPYYTNYNPSVELSLQKSFENNPDFESTELLRKRSERDRLYAQRVLDFVKRVDLAKVHNKSVWKAAEIQLLFLVKDFGSCLSKIEEFKKRYSTQKIVEQLEKIKALCLVSKQTTGNAKIVKAIIPIVLKHLTDERFLFSIGRELEFRGNLADGLAFISYANNVSETNYDYMDFNTVEWRGNKDEMSGNLKYFYEYFDYLDFVYSSNSLKTIIDNIPSDKLEGFNLLIYSRLIKDKNYLLDLLGTKFIRENKLKNALVTFKSIGQKYWEENYNAWERDRFDEYYSFDKNPFYDFKYTPNFIPHKDKFIVTKLSVTQHLLDYIELANNSNTKDRDYYYFLVANCYFNMTSQGNSWMMRRFTSDSNFDNQGNSSYVDENEYLNGLLAVKYYKLAYKYAKSEKFKALCLRMMDYTDNGFKADFQRVKKEYPAYIEQLSSCDFLSYYFKAR